MRRLCAWLLPVTLVLALGAAPPASLAQDKKKSGEAAAPPIDPLTGKRINEALEHLNAQRYGQAEAVLGKLNLERLSPYERSRVEQILASIDHAQEKPAVSWSQTRTSVRTFSMGERTPPTITPLPSSSE